MTDEARMQAASREQERLWAALALHGASPVFHRCSSVWLHGEVDVVRLADAVTRAAVRHELLRTTLVEVEGRLFQRIERSAPEGLVVESMEDPDAAVRAARAAACAVLDPRDAPPWRVRLIRTRAGRHLLLVVMHAVIADEQRSAAALLTELLTAGPEIFEQRPANCPCEGPRDADVAWWRTQIDGAPPMLELASDRVRPPVRSFAGHLCRRSQGQDLARDLHALAAALATEPSTVALAVAAAWLYRHTGQQEFAIGVTLPSDEDRPGPAGEPVLLCLRAGADDSLRALVERARQALEAAAEHGALAYMDAVEAARGVSPPFQVRLKKCGVAVARAPGISPVDVSPPHIGYDLELGVDTSEGLALSIGCSADLFEADTAARFLDHWEVLLAAAVAAPDRPISALATLTADERTTILSRWNPPATELPAPVRVHAQFEAQADRTPDAIAVTFKNDESLSYRALDLRASAVARRLVELGVGPDVPVALYVERSLDLAVGVLAILKAGGAYVPLDPSLPPTRMAWILEDTAVPVLVTQGALLGTLPAHSATHLLLDDFRGDAPDGQERVSVATSPQDLAYVIYTSGSTGRPKGIGLPHVALFNLIEWHARTLLGGVATLQFASIGFDASFHEMFAAWRTGGVVHLIDETIRRDVVRLAEFIR
ncbi:MAG TPA: AMP-binding protein, partial [Nannocystis sp.]